MKKTKKKDIKEPKEVQLDLGIKEPFKNRFYKVKDKADKAVRRLEVRKYLKDPLTWAMIIISIILILTQIYLIYSNWDSYPSLIPIFKYQIQNINKLGESIYILIFPTLSLLSLLFSSIITSKYYSRERYLTKFLLVASFLNTFSQTIVLIDLINSI